MTEIKGLGPSLQLPALLTEPFPAGEELLGCLLEKRALGPLGPAAWCPSCSSMPCVG